MPGYKQILTVHIHKIHCDRDEQHRLSFVIFGFIYLNGLI